MRRATRRLCASKNSPSCKGEECPCHNSPCCQPVQTSSFLAHSGAPAPIPKHTPKGWKEQGKLFWGRKETSPSRKSGTT